jgi:hypothetical protein
MVRRDPKGTLEKANMAPKKYGDKLASEIIGKDGRPIVQRQDGGRRERLRSKSQSGALPPIPNRGPYRRLWRRGAW